MTSIIRFPRKGDPPRMYCPAEIAEATGIKYDTALWLCREYGVKLRARYYISAEQYDSAMRALEGRQARGTAP